MQPHRTLTIVPTSALLICLVGCVENKYPSGDSGTEPTCEASRFYPDTDGDGYGDANNWVEQCEQPSGYLVDSSDCDDSDERINPDTWRTAADECSHGVDYNCDGVVNGGEELYLDSDGDGYGAGEPISFCEDHASGYAEVDGDCDDDDPLFHPGAPEEGECTDPNDYNCDGWVAYIDDDGDGYSDCEDCDDLNAAVYPGATEICGNDIDENCDSRAPTVCEGDTFSMLHGHACHVTDSANGAYCIIINEDGCRDDTNCYNQAYIEREHDNTPVYLSAGYENTCWEGTEGIACFGEIEDWDPDLLHVSPSAPEGFTDHTTPGLYGIQVGENHACALYDTTDTAGHVVCWGNAGILSVTDAPTDAGFLRLSSAQYSSCGLTADGVQCWGHWEIAGTYEGDFVQVDNGNYWGCALGADATVTCWGSNYYGERNIGSYEGAALDIGLGLYASCLVAADGTLDCWGDAYVTGEDGSYIPAGNHFVEVEVGNGQACALTDTGSVECWGFLLSDHEQATAPYWDWTTALECPSE